MEKKKLIAVEMAVDVAHARLETPERHEELIAFEHWGLCMLWEPKKGNC